MIRKSKNKAVSELIGVMLLLSIVTGVMITISFFVWDQLNLDKETFITILGKVENKNLIFEHKGGESISTQTHSTFTIAGNNYNVLVKDYLKDENHNDLWDYGERMVFPFEYDVYNLLAYKDINVVTVDDKSNSIVLMGPVDLHPISDIGVEIFVSNQTPHNGDIISITIVVTCYGGDVNGSANVRIQYLLPAGLDFIDYTADTGVYNDLTGFWDISLLFQDKPVSITINAQVNVEEITSDTQLGVILDGSGSISSSNWQMMLNGLGNAIKNEEVFPDNGKIELTVVQFGFGSSSNCYTALEISPVNVTEVNKYTIADQIRSMKQGNSYTPLAAGIYKTTDVLMGSSYFNPNVRKVILLVTDGLPNCKVNEGDYYGYNCGDSYYGVGKSCSEDARDYSIRVLGMNSNTDEFDCFAVGDDIDIEWLNQSIAWPEPSYIGPPFDQGTGWVTHINTYEEFEERLKLIFRSFFSEINNKASLYSSFTIDLIPSNNKDILIIKPES